MQGSVTRMSGMIDNVMDFARTRLGGGMQLRLKEDPLEPLIEQIVAEFRNVHPDRLIEADVRVRQGQNEMPAEWASCCRTCSAMRYPMALPVNRSASSRKH